MSAARDTSSSRVTLMQEERRVPHANLIQSLTHQMGEREIKEMKDYLLQRQTISRKQYEELDGLHAIVQCLEMEMKLTIGERDGYKVLIDALKIIKKDALANEVEQHQKKFCTDGEADKADKNKSQELMTELASKNETTECMKKEKDELLRDELSDLQKKVVTRSVVSNEMRREISNLRSQVEEYKKQLTTKENDYRQLQEELDTTKKKLQDESRGLQSDLDSLREDNHLLRSQVEEYKKQLTTNQKDYKQLQEELDTTKREKTELQEELDTTKKKLQGHEGVQLAKSPRDIDRCREVFTKEYGTNIWGIVNLGDRFAVAFCDQSNKIKGVDIYDISGVKKRTLKARIKGMRYLTVTPDKWILVAFCDGGREGRYTIRMLDTVSGYIRSTTKFSVDGCVQGFDVLCDGRKFVILHGINRYKVTVVGEDGSVVLTQEVESPSYFTSCGGRYVYTSRVRHVDVYEITGDRHLKNIAASQQFDFVNDVSATAAGEVTVTCQRGGRWCLGRAFFKDNKFSEWKYKDVDSRRQELVSVGGDHVVVAGFDNNYRMRILRVFKEDV